MTVASSTSKAGPYSGNGVTTAFAFSFPTQQVVDVKVVSTVTVSSVATDTTLTQGVDYTVFLNADQGASPGGSVTATVAPATGTQITVLRNVSPTQGAALPNQGGWYPKVVENALDKLTMLVQQLYEQVGRALTVSVSDSITNLHDLLTSITASTTAASSSASSASSSAATATTQAGIATTQAGLATTNGAAQVALAATQAGIATAEAAAAALSAAAAAVGITYLGYVSRASLRAMTPTGGAQAVVDGLGLFIFTTGSTETDDDETCFAATGGAWLLEAASWDIAFAYWLPEYESYGALIDDAGTNIIALQAFQAKFLSATFSMTLTTLAAITSSDFTVTVTGAALGDSVIVNSGDSFGTSNIDKSRLTYNAYVSATGTVTVSIRNPSAATASMTASTWAVRVIKQ